MNLELRSRPQPAAGLLMQCTNTAAWPAQCRATLATQATGETQYPRDAARVPGVAAASGCPDGARWAFGWLLRCDRMSSLFRIGGGGTAVVVVLTAGALVGTGSGFAATNPRPRPTVTNPHLCVETRVSWETIGDINALVSCKDKPGSIRIRFAQLFPDV